MQIATSTGETKDHDLWQRIRVGDEQAFTTIFEKYHRTLYNYGSKLSTNSSLVEDAVQDVFIDIWRLRHNLTENVTSVKFYLYRALRRRIHVALDKFPSMEEISELDDEDTPANHTHSEAILIEAESSSARAQRIQELLAQLPERQLEALTLRYFDDFSIDEIAEIMSVNEKSVRNFIYKALTSLRQSREMLLISSLIFWVLLFF
ncbi:RNA polymerase sigma-70 factor (ECF subfamily) [Dyadobacter sp. BE34]|uniref:RNA polymerase sigma-70 factor (ECF subfamily) n=1 Tax=Dyadobacter fermentans TaxID=94254 RepID=A0ABU1QR84_9BACT|nr:MULTISPECIES: RNA polymerase sigma factor [Dyadobacter]MDR6803666.1 RNA polymerase sigma-70 factor (ECF subfamily) [Dyadobacter fermentans]MDR7041406.1 RNA polymerase sigma-70 factor (ECF subfamily) [Dyadobacter sp. BE242]MDR7195810.1 RNA polymerase sigma-70 factor (ECF subfamily) [Dyadobacter sp. BE34]MDR7213646.1 RNA polymerase sigma-70 factor (ECF subfamily) [Dyadobacter sp. BE31]MDR7261216.1 RNA polymerase sigma-70 factor (ECF subfamily) [Dyadobacter sp. BE32]